MSGERFEFGIFTFGERTRRADSSAVAPRERLEEVLRWARTADQAGLDVVGVGEHHRSDFAISSPPVVLAAIARETARVQLTSTVTVLSNTRTGSAFDAWAGPRGALVVGSPAEIVDKILWEHEVLGHDRFLAQVGLGSVAQDATLRSIELLATEVAPAVRAALRHDGATSAVSG